MPESKENNQKKPSFWSGVGIVVGIFLFIIVVVVPIFLEGSSNNGSGGGQVGVGGGPGDILDKQIRIVSAPVQSVVNDQIFWIGTSENQRLLVVLESDTIPQISTKQNINISPGNTITLTGAVKKLPSTQEMQNQWNIGEKEAAGFAKTEQIYFLSKTIEPDTGQ